MPRPFYTSIMATLAPALLTSLLLAAPASAYNPRVDLDNSRYLKALWDAETQLKANPNNALAWAAKSQALSAMVRVWEARNCADKALALQPGLPDGLLARGMAQAGVAIQQRNLSSLRGVSRAMDDLRAAVASDPTLVNAWMSLGLAYQQLPGLLGGSTSKALQCAESLRRVNAPRADLLQGTVLAMDGRWNEAQPYFGRALATAPWDAEIVYGYLDALGTKETRKTLGEAEQRRRLASEARRLLPPVRNRARAVEAVSLALMDAKQSEEAWTIAKNALPQTDSPSLVRLHLGKIAAKTRLHQQEGLANLDQVLREPLEGGTGGYATAWWRKGQILKDLGRIDEAKAAADKALKIDAGHRGAKALAEEITGLQRH
ncbi:tetratricopeptide repeat protein [Holophaga foetida]|uniref:tetratricopeptide repeat protein n=1 Tax=Holophaga foetida TaxID=35839 RepID=UPI0002474CCB|nr:tetratricopeptide repeat protein [Holophaga foetida]